MALGQTSFRGQNSPFLQRIKHLEPRGKPIVPLEINIKCNEGLLDPDHLKLTELVTKFEQKRLKSLIREPGKSEETGFYSKIYGFQTKPKIFNKTNSDFLSKTLKHNSSLKNTAFAIEPEDGQIQSNLDDIPLTTSTNNIRAVTNLSEKERIMNRIKKSKFEMTPLEIKQLKDTLRVSSNERPSPLPLDDYGQTAQVTTGFLTSRKRSSHPFNKPTLVKSQTSSQIPKINPRLKNLYQSYGLELKQILMNKLNSSAVRDSQMMSLVKDDEVQQNPQQQSSPTMRKTDFDEFEAITEQLEETRSINEQQAEIPIDLIDVILDPASNIYQFNIDAINDKIYFQRVEKVDKDFSRNSLSDFKLDQRTMNLTSQGFIQDYDKPVSKNQHLKVGHYTILNTQENLSEGLQGTLKRQTTKKDELRQVDIFYQFYLKPKYSGSVNTEINKLDLEFIESQLEYRKKEEAKKYIGGKKLKFKIEPTEEREYDLIDEYNMIKEQKAGNFIMEGIWINYDPEGQFPSSREGSGAVVIDNKLWLLFGFQTDILGDLRFMDLRNQRWQSMANTQQSFGMPDKRFNFSTAKYKNSIVIFGGAQQYLPRIKQREAYNDIWIFNPVKEELLNQQNHWMQLPAHENIPEKRMMHDGCVYGCIFAAYGGITKQKQILSDLIMYDLESQTWIKAELIYKIKNASIGARLMHTLTTVMPEALTKVQQLQFQQNDDILSSLTSPKGSTSSFSIQSQQQRNMYSRSLMVYPLKYDKLQISGMYLFGGMDDKGKVHNDLWAIKPYYSKNQDHLQPSTCEYRDNFEKKIYLDIQLVQDFKGRPPYARCQHRTVFFQNKYLLIHGGRNNNEVYDITRNVALNDFSLFDLETRTWCIVSMLGEVPSSRWNHTMVASDSSKVYIFGGKNLLNYCRSNIYCFNTDKKKIAKLVELAQEQYAEAKIEIKKYKFI